MNDELDVIGLAKEAAQEAVEEIVAEEQVAPFPQYVFSNTPDNEALGPLLNMFYRAIHEGAVGIMQAKWKDTDEQHLLLVGLSINNDGSVSCLPLARALTTDEAMQYSSPDGEGGWYSPKLVTGDVLGPTAE